MLSEKRKKVKYSTDPNGNLWANDANGFGRQMLQRMGWSPGEGLGTNGTGIKAPIKASTQRGTRGLGIKTDYTLGSKQMDEYASLLKALNASCSSSGLKRSHSSGDLKAVDSDKSRPHLYQKMIKAKDASRYDKKALSVILGGTAELSESSELASTDVKTQPDPSPVPSLKTVNSSLSIEEYFEKCRKKMKFNGSSLGTPGNQLDENNGPPKFELSSPDIVADSCCANEKKDFSNDSVFYGTNLLTIPGYSCY